MGEISVVVPTFNRAALISDTLDAILSQSRPPDEVIVVDDGSTDGTAEVLEGYAGRVRCISIPNSGDLVARNTGLRAARGHLVAFCDSDDIWTPDFLAAMSAQWHTEPGLTACYANFRILQDGALSARSKFDDAPTGWWSALRRIGPDAGVFETSIVAPLLSFQPFFPSCMMVSATRFRALGGWDEGVSRTVGCDFATTLRIGDHPPVGAMQRPLVAIRKHASNFSGDTEKMNLGDARVLDYVLRTRPELAPLRRAIEHSAAVRRRGVLDSAFSRRDFATVRDLYALLPPGVPGMKHRVKRRIAGLPASLAGVAALLVSRPGSAQPPLSPARPALTPLESAHP